MTVRLSKAIFASVCPARLTAYKLTGFNLTNAHTCANGMSAVMYQSAWSIPYETQRPATIMMAWTLRTCPSAPGLLHALS